jgi:hypothetical protein
MEHYRMAWHFKRLSPNWFNNGFPEICTAVQTVFDFAFHSNMKALKQLAVTREQGKKKKNPKILFRTIIWLYKNYIFGNICSSRLENLSLT